MTSSAVIMPRSPWLASAACTKNAGVPVVAKVAAILRPIWPDLPSPVMISRPLAWRISPAAALNDAPRSDCKAAASAVTPLASASSVRSAEAIASLAWSVMVAVAVAGVESAMRLKSRWKISDIP